MSRGTLDPAVLARLSCTGLSPSLAGFPKTFPLESLNQLRGPNPGVHALRFGLFRFRSPLLPESHVVFSSSGYLDVSVHRVPFLTLCIGVKMTEVCSAGFPHSDISGSLDICSSPKLFAAYHVFHRLLVPRHPPYALSSITNLLRPRVWTSLHISSVICVGNSLLFLFVFSNQFSFLLLQASMITSDVLIFFLSFHFCMRFSRYTLDSFWNPMEITRFELVTSCLQGRRSPN